MVEEARQERLCRPKCRSRSYLHFEAEEQAAQLDRQLQIMSSVADRQDFRDSEQRAEVARQKQDRTGDCSLDGCLYFAATEQAAQLASHPLASSCDARYFRDL